MKRFLFLLTIIITCITGNAQLDSCIYSVHLHDSWGDGWDENQLQISINSSITILELHNGTDSIAYFQVKNNDTIELNYLGGGAWNTEVNFILLNNINDTLYHSPNDPLAGIHYIDSVNCMNNVGIKQDLFSSFSIYPNPNNGIFTVKNHEASKTTELSVTDIHGKLILRKTLYLEKEDHEIIDLQNLAKGMYLIVLNTNNTVDVINLIIN